MATVYGQEKNAQRNPLKAFECYLKAMDLGIYIDFDDVLDFYFNNVDVIGFEQLIKLIISSKKAQIEERHVSRIIDSIPDDVIFICSKEIVELIGRNYLSDKLIKKVTANLEEQDLIDFYINRLMGLSLTMDTVMSVAEERGWTVDDTEDMLACCDKILEELSSIAYHCLKKYLEAENPYAQFKIGRLLVKGNPSVDYEDGQSIRDCAIYGRVAGAIKEDVQKTLSDEELYAWGKNLLVKSYEQGNDDALIELGLIENEYLLTAYNLIRGKGEFNWEINMKLARESERAKEYMQAVTYLSEGFYNEKCVNLFVTKALKMLEFANVVLAKKFVDEFLDKVINGEINSNCIGFVYDELAPRLLNKKSYCYKPRYAVDILESKIFSSPYAHYLIGCLYVDGKHFPKNIKMAISYFENAANGHMGYAYYKLAYLYYYGADGVSKSNIKAKEYFEKALYCGENCEFAYEMVRADLGEKDGQNRMREYANTIINETQIGKKRNQRIQDDLKEEFGTFWDKLQEKTRDFIYSGIKTYINNYEEDDARYDYSAAINPMAKSLECELGNVFYTKYVAWLKEKNIDVDEYFQLINLNSSSDGMFTLGTFNFIAQPKPEFFSDYNLAKKYVKDNNLPAIIKSNGKGAKVIRLHIKFYEYVDEIFNDSAFSKDERAQEITAFIVNLIELVEDIRKNLRNEADHANLMNVGHAEICGNILYKTRKVIYNLISKLK